MLKKYVSNPSHAIEHQLLEIQEDLSYVEQPFQNLDQYNQVIQNKVIPPVLRNIVSDNVSGDKGKQVE